MMNSHDIPDGPWEKIGRDLIDRNGHNYLATLDYFSKYPCLIQVMNTNGVHTINHLKNIFSIQGVSTELMSDNRPSFSSSEFAVFFFKPGFLYT